MFFALITLNKIIPLESLKLEWLTCILEKIQRVYVLFIDIFPTSQCDILVHVLYLFLFLLPHYILN